MQNQEYFDATRSYKSLAAQYPFTPLAEKGMVDLVYVYYMNDEATNVISTRSAIYKNVSL